MKELGQPADDLVHLTDDEDDQIETICHQNFQLQHKPQPSSPTNSDTKSSLTVQNINKDSPTIRTTYLQSQAAIEMSLSCLV